MESVSMFDQKSQKTVRPPPGKPRCLFQRLRPGRQLRYRFTSWPLLK